MLAGGPLPPLVDDDKEEMGEVEGVTVSMPDYSVLDRDDFFCMEGTLEMIWWTWRRTRGQIPKIQRQWF